MKIYENVLSDNLLNRVHNEVLAKFDGPNWAVSDFFWHKGLKDGFSGNCLISDVDDDLGNLLKGEVSKLLPEHKYLKFQNYVWTKNSGISIHNDEKYKFGATIYLNQYWTPNFGGIFLWKEKDSLDHILKGICPVYNSMIVSDENESHMVTPVSPYATEFRVTIQIWGL
jgi:hypothetical protein